MKDLEQEVKDDIKEEKSLDDGTQDAWDDLSQAERDTMLAEESPDDETPSEDKPEEKPEEVEKPEVTPEEEKPYEVLDDGQVRIGKKTFPSVDEALKSHYNLEKVHGKQAQELGELRSQAVLPDDEKPEKETATELGEFNPYDEKDHTEYTTRVAKNASKEETVKIITEMIEKSRQEQALRQFQTDNPDLTTEKLKDVAQYGADHNIESWDSAYKLMQYDENIKKAEAKGKAEILEQLDKKSPKTSLSGLSSGDSETKIDTEHLSQKDFDNLPPEERDRILANA